MEGREDKRESAVPRGMRYRAEDAGTGRMRYHREDAGRARREVLRGCAGPCGARRGPRGGSRPFGMRRRGRRRAEALPGQPGPAASGAAPGSSGTGPGGALGQGWAVPEHPRAVPGRRDSIPGPYRSIPGRCLGLAPRRRGLSPGLQPPLPPARAAPSLPLPHSRCGAAGTRRNFMLSRSFKRHNRRKLYLE